VPARKPARRRLAWFALTTLAFGTSYALLPLYSSNQNHHFLIGIARAGEGWLNDDWLVHTIDPFPIFSAFVILVHRHFTDTVYYLLYYALLGSYAYGLMRMVEHVWPPRDEDAAVERLLFLAIVCVLHNEVIAYLAGVDLRHLPWWQMTHWGVAEQEIFGHSAFQPSAIGLLLPLALAWMLDGRAVRATLLAGFVLLIHFSYIVAVGSMIAAFMVLEARRTASWRVPLVLGALAVAMALPAVAYVLGRLGPTSGEIAGRAASILVDHIPQEADPQVWLGPKAYLQLAWMVIGVSLASETALFLPLVFMLIAGVLLTSAQLTSHNPQLALLFPWRVSVLLVPIATALVVRYAIVRSRQLAMWTTRVGRRRLKTAACVAIAVSMLASAVRMVLNFTYFYDYAPIRRFVDARLPARWIDDFARALRPDTLPMMDFVRRSAARGDLYVVPPELERFRLRASAPILADFKSHPYKDVEVIEWHTRLQLVQTFYESAGDCSLLGTILERYPVTHVVFDDRVRPARCGGLVEVYSDPVFDIYRVRATADVKIKAPACCLSDGIDRSPRARSALFGSCLLCR